MNKRRLIIMIVVLIGGAPWGRADLFPADGPKRDGNDTTSQDHLGFSAAMDGDLLVVGAPDEHGTGIDRGAAYLFGRDQGGAGNWGQVKKLTASDTTNGDRFGYAVAIDGDTVVVGAPFNDALDDDAGSIYVFERNEGGAGNWGEVASLTATNGGAADDNLGWSVGVSGGTAIAGAPLHGANNAGAAVIFTDGGGGWSQKTLITASDAFNNDAFGTAVDLDGDLAVVGAPEDNSRGSAYVFDRDQGGADNWGQVRKIQSGDIGFNDDYGAVVAIDGDRLVSGAPGETLGRGAAYVHDRNQGGANQWGQVKKLAASDGVNGDRFGTAVDVFDDIALVGSPFNHAPAPGLTSDSGSAYFFQRDQGGAGQWGQSAQIIAFDDQSFDEFGTSVTLVDGAAACGAPEEDASGSGAGAVYFYTFTENLHPVITNQAFSVAENSPNSTPVGTVIAGDPDAGQAITYSIVGGSGQTAFDINGGNGQVTVADSAQLDFETSPSLDLLVRVVDNGTPALAATGTVTVTLTDVPEATDIVVTKTALSTVVAGLPLSYTLTVSNAGPSSADNVILTDTLPPGVTPTGVQNFDLGTVTPGQAKVRVINVTVNSATTSALTNLASVVSSTTDSNPSNNTDTHVTTVLREADVVLTKTGPASAFAGTSLIYTVLVENVGPSDAGEVRMLDFLPPELGGTIVTNVIPSLEAGAISTSTVVGVIGAGFRGTITNLALALTSVTEPVYANNTNTLETTITGSADLSMLKEGPAALTNAAQVTYTLTAINLGPSTAEDVLISDIIPPGTGFDPGGSSISCANPFGIVECTVGDIPPNQAAEVTVRLNLGFGTTTAITNLAGASSSTPDPNQSNDAAIRETLVVWTADLALTKTGPTNVISGDFLTYTVRVSNLGPGAAVDVEIVDEVPAGLIPAGPVTNLVPLLASGQATTFLHTVQADAGTIGQVTNRASVTASPLNPDPMPGNNAAAVTTELRLAEADLAVTKTGPASVIIESMMTYTVTVENLGPDPAAHVVVVDVLPAGVTPTGPVTNLVTTLASGQSTTLTYTVQVDTGIVGAITNVASASSDAIDAVPGNNTAALETTILTSQADISMTKMGPAVLIDSNIMEYVLNVTNHGPSIATNALVADTLPSGVGFNTAGSSPACIDFGSGFVVCNLGNMQPGASTQLTLRVTVGNANTGFITNTATAVSDTDDLNTSNDVDTHATEVRDTDGDGMPDFFDIDDDNDGIHDTWETLHTLDPKSGADALLDPDMDTYNNLEEFTADTLPRDDTSFLSIKAIGVPAISLTLDSSPNRVYWVESLLALPSQTWTTVPGLTNLPGTGPGHVINDPFSSPGGASYRIRARLP